MTYEWEELSFLGKWKKVRGAEPPRIVNGRIKTAEGQGPKVRNARAIHERPPLERKDA